MKAKEKITLIIFYSLIALSFIFSFIPFFKVDLRASPNADHIYAYRSLFVLGFPRYSSDRFQMVFYYSPLLFLALVAIPFLNKNTILINVFLGLAIVSSLIEIIWFNNKLPFGILLTLILCITIVYNVYRYFLRD